MYDFVLNEGDGGGGVLSAERNSDKVVCITIKPFGQIS